MTRRSEVVVAGAGTGKTHALVEAYVLALLGLDGDGTTRMPDRLLAITFTDKAASEMRARVATRVSGLLFSPEKDLVVQARARELGVDLPAPADLERIVRALPSAPISTFHALCMRLVRDHALAAGVDPAFEVMETADEDLLLVETAEAVVLDALAAADGTLSGGLVHPVAELVARFHLRGFGSQAGLADCLVDVQGCLAERGLTADELPLCADPATSAAAVQAARDDVRRCLRALLDVQGLTDKAREKAQDTGAALGRLDAALADDDDPEAHVAAAFPALRGACGGGWGGKAVASQRGALVASVDQLGACLVDAAVAPLALAVKHLVRALDERQLAEKLVRGIFGFGDLLVRARLLLRDHPALRLRVKARFDRVLVDELQDTSPVQEDLVALLCEEDGSAAQLPRGARAIEALRLQPGKLFVVGDPKQSIYGFRGADARVFARCLDVVVTGHAGQGATGTRRALQESRRSRPAVCALVNAVARATLADLGSDELIPLRAGGPVAGALWRPAAVEGAPPLLRGEAEAHVLATRVRQLLDDGAPVGDDDHPARPADVCVLLRRIRPASSIARALAHVGVPARVTGGVGFYGREEVMDLVAGLRVIVEPDDELAVLTVLRSPLVAVPDDALVALHVDKHPLTWAHVVARVQAGAAGHEEAARVLAFDALVRAQRARLHDVSPARLVDALLDEGGYACALGVEPDALERLANVEKLRLLCEGRAGDAIARVSRLWGFLDDPPGEGPALVAGDHVDAVRIMTIHQAKGLEFPIVILADAGAMERNDNDDVAFDPDAGLAVSHRGRPIALCARADGEIRPAIGRVRLRARERAKAELARLLYVALTRARDHVFVIGEPALKGRSTLHKLVQDARALDPAVDRLLPVIDVPAVRGEARALPAQALAELPDAVEAPQDAVAPPPPAPQHRQELLAAALLSLLAEELDPAALLDEGLVRRSLLAGSHAFDGLASSLGVAELMDRCARTAMGPLRAALLEGWRVASRAPAGDRGHADLLLQRGAAVRPVALVVGAPAVRDQGVWILGER